MFNAFDPKKGSLLLAEPFMMDSNFERSVVLLCAHDPQEGTMGFVLNNRSGLVLSDLLPEIENSDFPVYIGGPVETDALYFLHTAPDLIPGASQLVDELYIGGDFEQVTFLMNANLLSSEQIKFFIGYAGWTSEQLAEEIKENSWAVHNKFPHDILFITDGEDLWKQALISLGPKYAHVAGFPKRPDLN